MTDDKDRKILSDEEMEDVAGGAVAAEAILTGDIAIESDNSISKGGGTRKKKQAVAAEAILISALCE